MRLQRFAMTAAFFAALAAAPLSASAGILGDMTQMFMSNSTAAGTLSTKDRNGVFGGSFSMRSPTTSINLVSFDRPRMDAGCGGVDLYGGSFTFINSQQLVQIFRQVAANAVGLAFKAAIKAISPSLDQLLTEFQTLLQHMNNLAKNTCQLAHLIVDPAEKAVSDAVGGDGSTASVALNMYTDAMGSLTGYLKDADGYLTQVGAGNPRVGNGAMKAIINSGSSAILGLAGLGNFDGSADNASDPNSLNNRLLISVMGYQVAGLPCLNQNGAGVPDATASAPNSTLSNVTCNGSPTITLNDLVVGGGTGSMNPALPLKMYSCVNPTGTGATGAGMDPQICTTMEKDDYNYPGIRAFINTALFGSPDPAASITPGSILGQFNSGNSVTLNATQYMLIHQTGIPLVAMLSRTSDPNVRVSIAQKLSEHVIACVAAAVGDSIYKAANGVQTGGENNLSDDIKKNIDTFRADAAAQRELCLHDHKILDAIQELNEATRLTAANVK